MATVFSYARLVAGGFLLFWGLRQTLHPEALDPALGALLAAVGLAGALHETAYVGARYLRASQDQLK